MTNKINLAVSFAALSALAAGVVLPVGGVMPRVLAQPIPATRSYLGFDRNDYPGDAAMKTMRRDFAFTSFWVSPPPGTKTNSWIGKREFLRSQGYGFVVLFSGPD